MILHYPAWDDDLRINRMRVISSEIKDDSCSSPITLQAAATTCEKSEKLTSEIKHPILSRSPPPSFAWAKSATGILEAFQTFEGAKSYERKKRTEKGQTSRGLNGARSRNEGKTDLLDLPQLRVRSHNVILHSSWRVARWRVDQGVLRTTWEIKASKEVSSSFFRSLFLRR